MLAGRPTSWKGYEILIQAASMLDDTEVCLLYLGAGDDIKFVEKLHQLAVKTGLGNRLRIATGSFDVPAAMMLADVVAMPLRNQNRLAE